MLIGNKNSVWGKKELIKPLNLIAHYTFDNTYNDLYDNYNPNIFSSYGFISSIKNEAIINPELEIPNSTDFSFTDGINDKPFSFDFLLYQIGTGNMNLISRRKLSLSNLEWQIFYTSGQLRLYLFDTSSSNYIAIGISNPLNEWVHLTYTYDGSGVIGGLKIYLNGISQIVTTLSSGTYNCMKISTSKIVFGSPEWSMSYLFNGYLDEFRIWSKELDATEVMSLYNEY